MVRVCRDLLKDTGNVLCNREGVLFTIVEIREFGLLELFHKSKLAWFNNTRRAQETRLE